MPAISASAPGKIILCGEHAVVYGQPAIAIPIFDVKTTCKVFALPGISENKVVIKAPVIGVDSSVTQLEPTHPLRQIIKILLDYFKIDHLPSCEIRIDSTIPVASGMGSSASTSVAMIRALSEFIGHPLENKIINLLAFEAEKIHHGTPSGIDNTVITYAKPILFIKNEEIRIIQNKKPLFFVIADTGIRSSTAKVVAEIMQQHEKDPDFYNASFEKIGSLTQESLKYLSTGDFVNLGKALTENHTFLQSIGVSCTELDVLVEAALHGGAYGAKLSGGGQGGNMLALVPENLAESVSSNLTKAGAVSTRLTSLPPSAGGEL
jgi:mevalonate kinase